MSCDRFHSSPAARASTSADGLIILDVAGGVVLASNRIGARIWELIDQRCTRTEAAHRLVEEYDISIERACGDVAAFVAALVERGLLIEEPPS